MKKFLILFLVLFLFCCAKKDYSDGLYSENKVNKNIEFINIYKKKNKIYIQATIHNEFINLVGDVNSIDIKNKVDNRIFENKIIRLNILEDENFFNKEKNLSEIEIIKYNEWSKIVLPILEKTILEIVPKNGNGIVISIANRDFVLYYNKKNMIEIEKLENIDNNIELKKFYSETEFYSILLNKIKETHDIKTKIKDHLIAFKLKIEGQTETPYVLFDVKNEELYYFSLSPILHMKNTYGNLTYYMQTASNSFIKSNFLDIIKGPITSTKKASTVIYQNILKTLEDKSINHLKNIPPINSSSSLMDIDIFEKQLDKIVGNKKYKGSMNFLIGGEIFFTDLLTEIQNAQNEIFIRLYIFSNDDYGVKIGNILKNKSLDGVDIRILTSSLANSMESMKRSPIMFDENFKQPKSIAQYLAQNSTVNLRTSADTFFILDHSKMIILDNKTAYVGGMNIGQVYRYSWHDMMVKLNGEIVNEIRNQFTENWGYSGPFGDLSKYLTKLINLKKPSKELIAHYNKDKNKQVDIRILKTQPQKKEIYEAQMLAIKNAKKYIYIQNPYLADYNVINALIEARGRGVDVRVILPTKNNVGMMGSSNVVTTNIFLKNGIKVYNYQGMTHIKAAIYDDWAILGSANFDNLSLKINDEFNIAFSDKYYVNKLKKELFEKDFKLSKEITKPYIINWYDKVMSIFANRF